MLPGEAFGWPLFSTFKVVHLGHNHAVLFYLYGVTEGWRMKVALLSKVGFRYLASCCSERALQGC